MAFRGKRLKLNALLDFKQQGDNNSPLLKRPFSGFYLLGISRSFVRFSVTQRKKASSIPEALSIGRTACFGMNEAFSIINVDVAKQH